MPLCRLSYTRLIFIIFIEFISSNHDHQHQILKADLGQTVTLSCLFDQDKIDQISFMRQMTGDILSVGRELFVDERSSNERMELKEISSNRLDLKLISVNENHSGIYTCMFNDEKLSSFLVQILVPPRFSSYFPLEGSLSYPEGSSMNFSCQAFAIPSANITWIYRNEQKQMKSIHHGENVYIPSIQSSDSGSYECIASNTIHASISRSFYLTVQYPPRLVISKDSQMNDIHDSVLIKCHICSIPNLIQVNWFRDEELLMDINIIIKTQTFEQSQCVQSTLEIVDISEYQFGRYQCRAENNLGERSITIDIEQNVKMNRKDSSEINRNGRTALLIDVKEKSSIPTWLSDPSIPSKSSHIVYFFSYQLILILHSTVV